jgi:formylglycine-generating enzyme
MRAFWTAVNDFLVAVLVACLAGCGDPPLEAPDATAPPKGEPLATVEGVASFDEPAACGETDEAEVAADAEPLPAPSGTASSCPDDMVPVETSFCPDIERTCLAMEHESVNNIDICHAFAKKQRCRGRTRPMAFCIDRYEYPNQPGAHPTWMLDWYKAQATCESKGKRLCYASEWTAACEGPEHSPFPYGWERDHATCNVDNFFIEPKKFGPRGQFLFYSKDAKAALDELARLDQSVPSGAMAGCTSGFGAHDMTGNLDEWVTSDVAPREKSLWSGLKGGAWGHVRNQCRPVTYSHDPSFAYYFVGFRCCRDEAGEPAWTPSPQAMRPPTIEPHDFAPDPVVVNDPAGPSKSKFTWVAHAQ